MAINGGLSSDMSLRDWFAGQALTLLGSLYTKDGTLRTLREAAEAEGLTITEGMASSAYELADALIRKRGKE